MKDRKAALDEVWAIELIASKLEKELQRQTTIMKCCQTTAALAGGAIERLGELIDDVQQDYVLFDAPRILEDIQKNGGYYLTPDTLLIVVPCKKQTLKEKLVEAGIGGHDGI